MTRQRTKGQSLVEMALILPIILIVVFGIIDMSWYIYGYSTIYQAARNGAEKAAEIPPHPSRINPLDRNELCVQNILGAIQSQATLFSDLTSSEKNAVTISYPATRALGEPIEIGVIYDLDPLTPMWQLVGFGNGGRMRVTTVARRSIENLGENPNSANLIACQP